MSDREKFRSNFRDIVVLSLFGGIMVLSDQMMNALPNIHLIAMFIILLTRFYRAKALYAIYLFVILDGFLENFFPSVWVMYSYIWLILWGAVMLLPKELSAKKERILYPLIGALHGLLFGILGAPAGYFMFYSLSAWSAKSFFAYILNGLPFDLMHMAGNLFACLLVCPLLNTLRMLREKRLL